MAYWGAEVGAYVPAVEASAAETSLGYDLGGFKTSCGMSSKFVCPYMASGGRLIPDPMGAEVTGMLVAYGIEDTALDLGMVCCGLLSKALD